jgi:PAS domain S-box-containing protein
VVSSGEKVKVFFPAWNCRTAPLTGRCEDIAIIVAIIIWMIAAKKSGDRMNLMTQFPSALEGAPDLRFQALFEGAAIGIGMCRLDGRIVETNPALRRMLGYDARELMGTHASQLDPEADRLAFPATFAPDESLLAELLRGQRAHFDIERRYRRKDGSELWGHLTVSLGLDGRGAAAFLIALLTDASEARLVQEHLRESEKMEVVGRLAGGIAHDFNNLLTGILLYCDLLSAGLEKGSLESNGGMSQTARETEPSSAPLSNGDASKLGAPDSGAEARSLARTSARTSEARALWKHVQEVRMAGEQGAALTRQLLLIAGKHAAEPRLIKVNEIVASANNLLQLLIGEQFELAMELDSELDSAPGPGLDLAQRSGAVLVLADPAQLRQVLLNLVLNARDAMPQGGKIGLRTRATEFPGATSGRSIDHSDHSGKARRAVSLTVQDSGSGMDMATKTRLFEPFYTTKKPGAGTGLGLATVQRIVSEAGGMIEVQSELGRGTLIEVFLPVVESTTKTSLTS